MNWEAFAQGCLVGFAIIVYDRSLHWHLDRIEKKIDGLKR